MRNVFVIAGLSVVLAVSGQPSGTSTAQSLSKSRLSDEQLLNQIEQIANKSNAFKVFVTDGVVTLDGTVKSEVEKRSLEAAVGQIRGVKEVNNNLTVIRSAVQKNVGSAPSSVYGRGHRDDDLQTQVRAIANHSKTVKASVRDGIVTLDGSVKSEMEKNSLEGSLGQLPGVNQIDNNLKVIIPPEPQSVGAAPVFVSRSQQSDQALLSRVDEMARNNPGVNVTVREGVVTLDGAVKSDLERRTLGLGD